MAQPVWVLSVDLQTKTATFQSGLAEAARSARTSFGEISAGAGQMGASVGHSSLDVRHSLGLVDNVIRGAHAQAMADLIRMYARSAAVMTLLPLAATAAGFALVGGIVYEVAAKIREHREEMEKLANAETVFGTTANNAFRQLDDRILEATKRADELRNDHLGALHAELQLIDNQSMTELVKSLETVAKAADDVFKLLQGHWYTFGQGSAGASHALEQFKIQYDNLLSKGDEKGAGDLLHGTLQSAQTILQLQQQVNSNKAGGGLFGANQGDAEARAEAQIKLRALGVGYTEKEVQAQQQLVDALSAQVTMEGKIAELKKLDTGNAKTETGNAAAAMQSAAARAAAESQLRMGQSAIAGDRATADAQLTIHRASIEARLQSDLDFADRETALQQAANQAEIAALDKSGKDYQNQLKALQDKALELTQAHETAVAELRAKASIEANQRDLENYEESEREKIDAAQKGSAARLAIINAAIQDEESRGLQDTNFYRDLLTQRVEATRQEAEEEAKLKAEAGKEAADNEQKMGELLLAAAREKQALQDSARRMTDQQRMREDIQAANAEFALKQTALDQQINALDKSGKDYNNKLQELQDKQKQLVQQHENEITAIRDKAEDDRNQNLLRGEKQLQDGIASSLTQVVMGHKSLASALSSIGNEIASGMIQNAIKSIMANDMTKESDAAAAARKAFNAGMSFPFPANIVMGPALGAMAFASVMAFEAGTDNVPGVGRGDTVPALLSPGEGVVPGGVMDGLRNMARSGHMGGGHTTVVHVRPTYHLQALDGDGIATVLDKHSDTLAKHFHAAVRKMNR
jgi:hypothetical protein